MTQAMIEPRELQQRMPMPVGLLLAAGYGRRFGGDKLSARLADGRPVAVAALAALLEVLPQVIAVVRPDTPELARMLAAAGARVVECPDAARGMGASLGCGVRASAGDTPGWIVALGDMPYIEPLTIRSIAGAIAGGALIAAPAWQGQRGHPVGFAGALRAELEALDGDTGARPVIDRHRPALRMIECADPGVVRDIDRPDDLGGA
jgi:molybdenum cofactor cytidylyltransferase